jgi:ribosomal protein L7Ae-like RNA K-turn-binding protein
MSDKFYRMLGLAVKAGSAVFGEGAVKDSLKSKTAGIVLVSEDASHNTKKKFQDSCRFYSVPYFEAGDRYELGNATGRGFAVVIAVTNQGLAKNLIQILTEQ